MALTTYRDFRGAGTQGRDVQAALWTFKGTSDDDIYVLEVDPATGSIPVSFGGASIDFGATTSALRLAAMVGGYDELPTPVGSGTASGFTGTILEKSVANDGRAQDTAAWLKDYTGAYQQQAGSPSGNLQVAGLVPEQFEAVAVAYPSTTTETYTYYRDAAMTTSICVITATYTDTTKNDLSSLVRT